MRGWGMGDYGMGVGDEGMGEDSSSSLLVDGRRKTM